MVRVQVKIYRKKYLTERKGYYLCKQYYIYLPKHIAEPLVGKNLTLVPRNGAVLVQPIGN